MLLFEVFNEVFKKDNFFHDVLFPQYFETHLCKLLFEKHSIDYSLCKRFIGHTLMCLKWYTEDRIHPIICVRMHHNSDRIALEAFAGQMLLTEGIRSGK